jgi:hypothetical protein
MGKQPVCLYDTGLGQVGKNFMIGNKSQGYRNGKAASVSMTQALVRLARTLRHNDLV